MNTRNTLVLVRRRARWNSLPSALVRIYAAVLEVILEEHREEDAEERPRKDTALFHTAAYREGLGGGTVEVNCAVHVVMEGGDSSEQVWGQPIFGRSLKSPLLLTRSNAFVRSMKTMKSGICCS